MNGSAPHCKIKIPDWLEIFAKSAWCDWLMKTFDFDFLHIRLSMRVFIFISFPLIAEKNSSNGN